jgi:hypothetical protein
MLAATFVLGLVLIVLGIWRWARPNGRYDFDDGPPALVFLSGVALWALALYLWLRSSP